jgi:type I pantothenate kinase
MSLYLEMTSAQWGELRADTPMVLDADDIERLRGINERVSMEEVEQIYLPLSRLLNLHVSAKHALHRVTSTFLKHEASHVPFVIGIAGSVAVGKSTTARLLQALLSRWPDHPSVSLIATDGFLFPNRVLTERGIMHRKGFPESYDVKLLIDALAAIKAGERNVSTPVYSHTAYDVLDDDDLVIDQPDVVIVEGLNVLQAGRRPADGESPRQFVSDFFDFSIYVDADAEVVKRWFLDRFAILRQTAFRDEASHFHRYAAMSDDEANAFASNIWETINGPNLVENILPTRERASLILRKSADHAIDSVALRRR